MFVSLCVYIKKKLEVKMSRDKQEWRGADNGGKGTMAEYVQNM